MYFIFLLIEIPQMAEVADCVFKECMNTVGEGGMCF